MKVPECPHKALRFAPARAAAANARARNARTHFSRALGLFAERGFMETTVEDVTEAADVGKGTFFNYFPTKEHVLATYGQSVWPRGARAGTRRSG